MTIRPVQSQTGWEVLQANSGGEPFPLPGGMRVQTSTKESANDLTWMVAEQLGSLGFQVQVEEVE